MDGFSWTALIGALLACAHLAICVAALGVIPGNRKPSTGMAWLLLILAVPFFGFIAFMLFGSTHVEKKRHEKQKRVNDLVRERTADLPPADSTAGWPAALTSATVLNRKLGTLPVVDGNTVELYPDYEGYFAAMAEAVDAAERFVHVEFYITAWDSTTSDFFDALVRARERGVVVRVLFDHLGSRSGAGYSEMLKRLDDAGIAWKPMLPIAPLRGKVRRPDLRNHRKILVVDNTTAFMGSQNMIETTYGVAKNIKEGREYVELNVRIHGPVVPELNVVFGTDWYSETNEILNEELKPPTDPHVDSTTAAGRVPGPPERPGLRHREQPAAVHHADLLRPETPLDHQPVLRPGRVPAVRDDDRSASRRGRRAVRERGGGPVHGRACAVLVLRGAPPRPASRSTSIRRRGSCTPSTSASTTRSP